MSDGRPDPEMLLAKLKEEAERGELKIFLGYAAGVGKTYAMLDAAHQAKKNGKDVVVGYVEPHPRPETTALLEDLEQIATKSIHYKGRIFHELDIDEVLRRKPEIVLVDELAHTNAPSMRHVKRYGDVEELLAKGIHVYTTVNIQHIESLHDIVEEITGVKVRERIPDYIIDEAAHIKLVDVEPEELLHRLKGGKIYLPEQVEQALQSFFQRKNLVALREMALRRTADTIYHKKQNSYESSGLTPSEEHILVGLSSSPTNAKVIRTAARLAQALHGKLTGIYVQKDLEAGTMTDEERLRRHFKLAEQLGARVVIIQEAEVAAAIANYAQMSGATKLVLGRSAIRRKWWQPRAKISDQLGEMLPNLAIHIVPDHEHEHAYFSEKRKRLTFEWRDLPKIVIILGLISFFGLFFFRIGISEANIITLYILGILILAIWSSGWLVSIISSTAAVLLYNYLFIEPRLSFEVYHRDSPITFFIMFVSGVITGSLAKKIKEQAASAVRKSYRTEVLLETNRRLQYAKSLEDIITEGMSQIVRLTGRPAAYFEVEDQLIADSLFFKTEEMSEGENQEVACFFEMPSERGVVNWVINNKHIAGVSTDIFPAVHAYYVPMISNGQIKGVVGISLCESNPLPSFEENILHAILNDFSFALEKWHLQKLNEAVAKEAELEQMRANLLRAVSHDLRTPLTSISGNADILLREQGHIQEVEKRRLYQDIYENSTWLVQMVENLLAVSRLEGEKLAIEMQVEVVEEMIQEALCHVGRTSNKHIISWQVEPELLLARMDARLIIQVFINIIDNALKYTPENTTIEIHAWEGKEGVQFSIEDNGPGIEDKVKERLFDPFTTGKGNLTDSRRGLGLGLALCQTILKLHGSELTVTDRQPRGTVFSFSLKKEAVDIDE